MNKSEKEELAFQRFINTYKHKTYDEIVSSTLNIKSSDISSYEYTLLDIIRGGINPRLSVGMLVERKMILARLISNGSPAKEILSKHLQNVLNLLER